MASRYTVHVIAKALEVLEELAHDGPLSLAELAQQVEQPKSSVFRYLVTLEERGYVRRNAATEQYSLGIKLIELGNLVTGQFNIHEEAIGYMRQLLDKFRETVNLAILEDGKVVYLDILEGTQSVRMAARPGQRDFAHSTAIGKSHLSYLPQDQLIAILRRHGLPTMTEATITTIEDLQIELQRVRERGYAIDNMENEPGVRCVGAPIFNHQSQVIAAISVSGPASRITPSQVETIGRELVVATRMISERLGYRGH